MSSRFWHLRRDPPEDRAAYQEGYYLGRLDQLRGWAEPMTTFGEFERGYNSGLASVTPQDFRRWAQRGPAR